MNSLPLSSLVISYATLKGKPLLASPVQRSSAKLEPRLFFALSKNCFGLCIKFDKGGNSLPKHLEHNPNIRSNQLRHPARAQAPIPLPHMLFGTINFSKPLPWFASEVKMSKKKNVKCMFIVVMLLATSS